MSQGNIREDEDAVWEGGGRERSLGKERREKRVGGGIPSPAADRVHLI
jgi:hypothetical protein